MRLRRLIQQVQGLTVRGSSEIEITGLCANSKRIAPGNLFIAKRGLIHDGNKFIPDAIEAGAVAVLTDMHDPFLDIVQLIHPDVAHVEGKLAAAFYNYPSSHLRVIGVTGTNGKTTSSYLIKHILDKEALMAGLIGTVEWIIGDHRFSGTMTTPDVITNHKLLKEMHGAGCKAAVMEVSSHGLSQKRVEGIDFDIALFTNLTPEHLDYHRDMENYQKAKEMLFTGLGEDKWAVRNADDPFAPSTKARVMTYGIHNRADLVAKKLQLSEKKSQFTVCYRGEEVECKSSLIGHFNVYNLLGAIGVGICCHIPLERCVAALKTFRSVPGRLERVKNPLGIHIFVDFAHTEDALTRALETLSSIKKRKLITVFGCGGDRDMSKRMKMGAVARRFSDETIITSDNPRGEEPKAIASEILKGFHVNDPVRVELDRKAAIKKALEIAHPDDILLISGKGHEREQIFAHQVIPFDDVKVTEQLCQEMGTR